MNESSSNQASHMPSIVENQPNQPNQAVGPLIAPPIISEPVKWGRGCPKGSKNKPKVWSCSEIYYKLISFKITSSNLLEPNDDAAILAHLLCQIEMVMSYYEIRLDVTDWGTHPILGLADASSYIGVEVTKNLVESWWTGQ